MYVADELGAVVAVVRVVRNAPDSGYTLTEWGVRDEFRAIHVQVIQRCGVR